jgi:hypothetical protein
MAQEMLEKHLKGWIYEAAQDVVGLWNLCHAARYDWGATRPEEIKALVLGFVRELLANGVQAINVSDGRPWPDQQPDSVIERISREWDALGREPNVPDIVWFKKQG